MIDLGFINSKVVKVMDRKLKNNNDIYFDIKTMSL